MTDVARIVGVVLSVGACYLSRPMPLPLRIGAALFVTVTAFAIARDRR